MLYQSKTLTLPFQLLITEDSLPHPHCAECQNIAYQAVNHVLHLKAHVRSLMFDKYNSYCSE